MMTDSSCKRLSVLEPDPVRQQLIVNCERAQYIPFCLFTFIIAKNLISDLLHWHVHRSLWIFGEDFKTSVFGFAVCMAGCEWAQASLCFSCKVLLPCVEKKYSSSSCSASGCLISLQVCFVVHFSSCVFLRPLSGFPLCCWPNLNEILDLTAPQSSLNTAHTASVLAFERIPLQPVIPPCWV